MKTEHVQDNSPEKRTKREKASAEKRLMQKQESVAFRVIGFKEDSETGRTPIWGPFPLTEEEEAVLARITGIQ